MSNVEVWNRFAQSFLKKTVRQKKLTTGGIHYSMFDVGRSMFEVHYFLI